MKAIKHSKQRDSIKTCLMGRRDHPTADAVYMSIREEFPNIRIPSAAQDLSQHQSWNRLPQLKSFSRSGRDPEADLRQWTGPVRRRYQPTLPFCMQTLRRRV